MSYAFRSGYQTGSGPDGLTGVSVGTGLTFGRASIDFAWVPFGELGNTYRYALHLKFGPPDEPAKPKLKMQKAEAADPALVDPSLPL